MVQGDASQPGERRCPDCDRRWYSAALLNDEDADCPDCGAQLAAATEAEAEDTA